MSFLLPYYSFPSCYFYSTVYTSSSPPSLEILQQIINLHLLLSSSSLLPSSSSSLQLETLSSLHSLYSIDQLFNLLSSSISQYLSSHPSIHLLQPTLPNDLLSNTLQSPWKDLFFTDLQSIPSSQISFSFSLSTQQPSSSSSSSSSILLSFNPQSIHFFFSLLFPSSSLSSLQTFLPLLTQYLKLLYSSSFPSFEHFAILFTLLSSVSIEGFKLFKDSDFEGVSFELIREIMTFFDNSSSYPSHLLAPFLYPLFRYSLEHLSNNWLPYLSCHIKVYCISCLPWFCQWKSSYSEKQIQNSEFFWNSYHLLQYWFCQIPYCVKQEEIDNEFGLNLFIYYFPCYLKKIMLNDQINQVVNHLLAFPRLCYELISYCCYHIQFLSENEYQFLLHLSIELIRKQPRLIQQQLENQAMNHSCNLSTSLVLYGTYLDKESFISLFQTTSRSQLIDCFIECVLCLQYHCKRKGLYNRCCCLACKNHTMKENDLSILRESLQSRRDQMIQYIHLLLPGKTLQQHPFYSLLKQCFSFLFIVYLITNISYLSFNH